MEALTAKIVDFEATLHPAKPIFLYLVSKDGGNLNFVFYTQGLPCFFLFPARSLDKMGAW